MKNEIVYNLLTLYMNYYIFLSNRMQLRVSNIKYKHLYSIDGFSRFFKTDTKYRDILSTFLPFLLYLSRDSFYCLPLQALAIMKS